MKKRASQNYYLIQPASCFIEDKKAISGIIVSMILIAFALVVVGIVWYVLNNVIESTSAEINQSQTELFQSCSEAGYNVTEAGQTCNGTVKYMGGEKCCDGVVS